MLLLRFFANCKDKQEADMIVSAAINALAVFNPVQTMIPQPYWKISDYFEFSFSLTPATKETFYKITAMCSDNWLNMGDDNDLSSVWNRKAGLNFIISQIAWVEVIWFPD